jgi:aminoglycoside/choline kinase family phosphotransferase
MDAPAGLEDIGRFATVAQHLLNIGFKAPKIIGMDREDGLLLLEDFGDKTFTRLIADGADDTTLYAMAIDVLIALHNHPRAASIDLPLYDQDKLIEEALLLTDWYAPVVRHRTTNTKMRQSYITVWRDIIDSLPEPPTTLVLRDFHVDNLMCLQPVDGLWSCGLLDFQDAVIGPPPYDVVSLLEDARREIDSALVEAMKRRYLDTMPLLDIENFNIWYKVLGVQRHCKIAGIFLRLLLRDGKPIYVKHIPRVTRLLERGLDTPVLWPLRQWLDYWLPQRNHPFPDVKVHEVRQLIELDDRRPTSPPKK